MKKNLIMWEILVPCAFNDGKIIETAHHHIWDETVEKIAGGLTINKPTLGKWNNGLTQQQYHEKMIPVKIACDEDQIEKIVEFTAKHYKQIAVMYYEISSDVRIFKCPCSSESNS